MYFVISMCMTEDSVDRHATETLQEADNASLTIHEYIVAVEGLYEINNFERPFLHYGAA